MVIEDRLLHPELHPVDKRAFPVVGGDVERSLDGGVRSLVVAINIIRSIQDRSVVADLVLVEIPNIFL